MVSPGTGLLCLLSATGGLSIGLGMSAWSHFVEVKPVLSQSFTVEEALINTDLEIALQPFFPELEHVENAVATVKRQNIIRADQLRQQQLEQTIDVLTFHGATVEDITRHVQQQLGKELENR